MVADTQGLLTQLANTGVLGAVLVWFMFRVEQHLKRSTEVMERTLQMLSLIEYRYRREIRENSFKP